MATFTVSMTVETPDDDDMDSTLVERVIREMVSDEHWQIVSLLVVGA
ncbi:MAG: hypothetical protein ACHQ8D_09235 [Candidatus Rokuibacteriota bacterium]|jgi:hypothetical protein